MTRSVADGIGGLVSGALAAIGDAFWTIVNELQVLLPGPLFYLVVGGGFLALLLWTIRK